MFESRFHAVHRLTNTSFWSACLAILGAVLSSCQTSTGGEATRTGEKSVHLEIRDRTIIPDSAFATISGRNQVVRISPATGDFFAFSMDFDAAPGINEKIFLHLESYGLVTAVVPCVLDVDGNLVQSSDEVVRDTMARTVVRRLDGTTYPKSKEGAIQAYADALLENQPLFQPFPQTVPKGLDTANVRIEALRRAAKAGKSLEQLVGSWGLAQTYLNAQKQILSLRPSISSADSAILFPPPHVRLEKGLSSLGDLGAGGDAVGIAGSIASDIALASVDIDVLDANGVLASDKFAIRCSQPKGSLLWDLVKDGQVSIRAVDAVPGTYTVQIIGRDIQGRSVVLALEITVRVVGGVDLQGPTLRLVSPVSDISVEYTVATFDVVVSATDPSGTDSVWIGGAAASKNFEGNWHRVVVLDTTGAATALEIAAFDTRKNATRQTVRITRKTPPGVVVPVIHILEPTQTSGLVLPFETSTLLVKWTVSDRSGIAEDRQSITGGTPSWVSDSSWQAIVVVPATGKVHTVQVEAKNKQGKTGTASFGVMRKSDTVPPRIIAIAGSRWVSTDTSIALASWMVTDNYRLDSVLILGILARPDVTGAYSVNVPMTDSVNKVAIVAVDSFRNRSYDTIVLRRGVDKTPPEITAIAPTTGQTVDYATSTFLVRIKATDASGIDIVQIQGAKVDSVQSEYSREVLLTAIGSPTSIAIHVVDKQGNPSDLVLHVTRNAPPDNTKPSLALVSPSARTGVAIPVDSASVLVRWKAEDFFGIAASAVSINGVVATKEADSSWSSRVALPPTGTAMPIPVVVTNIKGVSSLDTVFVARVRDTIRPKVARLAANPSSVPYSTESVGIGWIVTDNCKLSSVSINGSLATSVKGDEYSSTIDLVLGDNKVALLAKDSLGNERRDTVVVSRVLGASPVLTFSHPEGTYDSTLHVTITSSVPNAEIRYTLDGTDPSETNGLSYAAGGNILIGQTRTLKVIASATGTIAMPMVTKVYTFTVAPVTFSVPSGTSTDTVFKVKVTSSTAGTSFFYTLDGTNPIANSSPLSSGEITIDSLRTLKVIAVKSGWNSSAVATATYRANVAVKVFVGAYGSKVIRADGSLWTKGRAASLADGTTIFRMEFAKALEGVQDVNSSLILMRNGDVLAYGGEFGSTVSSNLKIATGMKKIAVSTEEKAAMMINDQNALFAFGPNGSGYLCTGDVLDVTQPKQVATGVKSVGMGCYNARGAYACASIYVTTSGNAYSCGNLDLGVVRADETLPSQLSGTGFSDVFIFSEFYRGGYSASYTLLKTNGDLIWAASGDLIRIGVVKAIPLAETMFTLERYGWLYAKGVNNGRFGDGTLDDAPDWKELSSSIQDVSSYGYTTMIIKTDGSLWENVDGLTFERIHLPN